MSISARSFALALSACLIGGSVLPGCTTTNPFTGEGEMSKMGKGVLIGALAGAAAGALSGDGGRERRNRALLGAGLGGLTGGAIGAYMDVQENKLRAQLSQTGVSVTRVGDEIILNMPGNVTFSTDSADLRPGFFDVLASVGLVLTEYGRTMIEVEGHTDSTGLRQYNMALSERRASSVARFLGSQGVNNQRIFTRGFGPDNPIAPNDSASGRQANRRVELRLVPIRAGV